MSILTTTSQGAELDLGASWVIEFTAPVSATVSATIREPNAATPAITVTRTGTACKIVHTLAQAGRYRLSVTVTEASITEIVTYSAVSIAPGEPPLDAEIATYLGEGAPAIGVISDALDAETVAQYKACNITGRYPADLAQALKRRVARNLAMRGLPLAIFTGGDTTTNINRLDVEIRRLEGPYRRRPIG